MPIKFQWIDPALFLKEDGVQVFHTYKHDDHESGPRDYWFSVSSECNEESSCNNYHHIFDVRKLSTWRPSRKPPYCIGPNDTVKNRKTWEVYWKREAGAIRSAITGAIRKRELTRAGLKLVAAKHKSKFENLG